MRVDISELFLSLSQLSFSISLFLSLNISLSHTLSLSLSLLLLHFSRLAWLHVHEHFADKAEWFLKADDDAVCIRMYRCVGVPFPSLTHTHTHPSLSLSLSLSPSLHQDICTGENSLYLHSLLVCDGAQSS